MLPKLFAIVWVFQFTKISLIAASRRAFPFVSSCTSRNSNYNTTLEYIRIPANFTRHGNHSDKSLQLPILNLPLLCKDAASLDHTLVWKDDPLFSASLYENLHSKRNFLSAQGASVQPPLQFLEDGTFFNGSFYFRPDGDYCIVASNVTSVTLRLCPLNSEQDIYIPKCCAIDEIVHKEKTCTKLTNNQSRWTPNLFEMDAGLGKPHILKYEPRHLRMYVEDLPSKCRVLQSPPNPYFFWWSPTGHGLDIKHNVKLVLLKNQHPQKVIPFLFYPRTRRWQLKDNVHFCVDGKSISEGVPPNIRTFYRGDEQDFVIYGCRSDEPDPIPRHEGKAWIYAITSSISSLFSLFTVVMYLLLIKQHNLYGLLILMHTIAMLGRYAFASTAFFISIFPNDHITGVMSRGWTCYIIGIVGHYFYLASFTWLTTLNFNFVYTFSKVVVAGKQGKQMKTFLIYCLVSWCVPIVLVISFVAIDYAYRDPNTEVPVPGYGDHVCFVARAFRGYYVYLPMALIVCLNIPLVLRTFAIFWKARVVRNELLQTGNSRYHGNAVDYSAAFFLKVFLIMGGGDLIHLLTWWYHELVQGNTAKPGWVIALEATVYLTPVLLFGLFCRNKRIRHQCIR